MGWHFGLLAGRTGVDEFLAAVSQAHAFRRGEEVVSLSAVPNLVEGEHPLVTGERNGATFVLDSGLLVATNPDLVVEASRRLGGVVVGAGAETTSGTYWLTVAEAGDVRRLFWQCLTGQSEAQSVGEPFPSEATSPLEHPDGAGLLAVLSAHGFDYPAWADRGPFALVRAKYGDFAPGPLGQSQGEFVRSHPLPPGTPTDPVVVERARGSFDLLAPGTLLPDGMRVAPNAAPEKKGRFGRLFGRG